MTKQALLDEQIAAARRTISTDSYPMSIGELSNLYRDGELIIDPEFQRLFRWDDEQKSRLVESVLLGIPLPSIFVSQIEDGKWELIDGLQRVSTLLQLQGLLPNYDPLVLEGTKYLKGMDGMQWDGENGLSSAMKLDVKRAKLDLKIIKRESSAETKYDLFQRLNSYGSPLTPQEMRHALLVGINPGFAGWVAGLSQEENFQSTLALPEKLTIEKYDEDLVLRFLYLHANTHVTASDLRRFNQRLDDASVEMAETFPLNSSALSPVFAETFRLLNEQLGSNSFRKWDVNKDRFVGGFLNTAFEVIGMGLGYHIANGSPHVADIREAAVALWHRPEMTTKFATGVSTEKRLAMTLPLGRELLSA